MEIKLASVGKKFKKEWIIKDFTQQFNLNDRYVIKGSNGSGKSTFLKLISGFLTPTTGNIAFSKDNHTISDQSVYKKIAYCSPYIDVFEEYTINELFQFYTKLQPLKFTESVVQFNNILELANTKNKPIKDFSSGMKQRVKLALAILSDAPILLLDEPTSNLDKQAINWYQQLVTNNLDDKIVFVASNVAEEEYFFCDKTINIMDYKLKK